MLNRRMNLPTVVMRGSFFILNSTTLPASRCSSCSFSRRASASTTIDRNLIIRKISPLMPTRSCRKNTGPLLVNLMAAAKPSSTGENTRIRNRLPTTSKDFFRIRLAPR